MKVIINTSAAPAAIGSYSQAVKVNQTVYISGQLGLDPITMQLVSDDFVDQAHQVFKNLQAIANAANATLQDAVKLTVYLIDLAEFAQLNEVMMQYVIAPYPARAAVQVVALPRQGKIEIDAVLEIT